jgi:integrase
LSKEKRRRDYGSGAIYQRKSDAMWVGTIEAGWTAKGTRRRIPVYGKTQAVVKRKLRDKRLELEAGATSTSARASIKSWAEQWLPIAQKRLSPDSFTTTRTAVNRYIVPTIGHKRFADLTPGDVRAVAAAIEKAGRTTSTSLRYHSVLMVLLKDALAEGHPVPQRLFVTERPRLATNDRTDMTVNEASAILHQTATLDLPHRSRYVAALLQGMRQAEALGLTWEQVDLAAETATISWQLKALPYNVRYDRASGFRIPDGYEHRQVEGRLHLVRPKSKKGWRVQPLVPWMRAEFERWEAVAPKSAHGLVWPNLDGRPTLAGPDDEEWYALQGSAGVGHPEGRPYTIHEARHTTATLLMELGVDPHVITQIMGHSSIVTSRGYQHVSQRHTRAALEKVAALLQLGGPES